ncbi:hypothetical protein [Variovorax soli]|uniref:hypothetical protein n=1 Tax=Variovorax soli TaxID=376815 RepID=UPI000838E3B8|nr:hypothetical protein [Variovorax soli]
MPELIATRRFTYGTRRLQADDPFPATKQDARVLTALGKARYATAAVTAPVQKQEPVVETPEVAAQEAAPEVAAAPAAPEATAAVTAPGKRGRKAQVK